MDGRRLEDGSPQGPNLALPGFGSRQPPPEAGQAQTKMQRLLKPTRRWDVPIPCNAQEFIQASPSYITTEGRNHVPGGNSRDHPKLTLLAHGLDVRRPE